MLVHKFFAMSFMPLALCSHKAFVTPLARWSIRLNLAHTTADFFLYFFWLSVATLARPIARTRRGGPCR